MGGAWWLWACVVGLAVVVCDANSVSISTTSTSTVALGQTATVTVNTTLLGSTATTYQWFSNATGTALADSATYSGVASTSLVIDTSQLASAESVAVSCVVGLSSAADLTTGVWVVTVVGPPQVSTPSSVTGTYLTNITITATASAGTNGGAVASYRWYSARKGALEDLDGFLGTTTTTLTLTAATEELAADLFWVVVTQTGESLSSESSLVYLSLSADCTDDSLTDDITHVCSAPSAPKGVTFADENCGQQATIEGNARVTWSSLLRDSRAYMYRLYLGDSSGHKTSETVVASAIPSDPDSVQSLDIVVPATEYGNATTLLAYAVSVFGVESSTGARVAIDDVELPTVTPSSLAVTDDASCDTSAVSVTVSIGASVDPSVTAYAVYFGSSISASAKAHSTPLATVPASTSPLEVELDSVATNENTTHVLVFAVVGVCESGVPVGAGLPQNQAFSTATQSLSFSDCDPNRGEIQGGVEVTVPQSSALTNFELFFGSSATTKSALDSGSIGTVSASTLSIDVASASWTGEDGSANQEATYPSLLSALNTATSFVRFVSSSALSSVVWLELTEPSAINAVQLLVKATSVDSGFSGVDVFVSTNSATSYAHVFSSELMYGSYTSSAQHNTTAPGFAFGQWTEFAFTEVAAVTHVKVVFGWASQDVGSAGVAYAASFHGLLLVHKQDALELPQNTRVPDDATHLLSYAVDTQGCMSSLPVAIALQDLDTEPPQHFPVSVAFSDQDCSADALGGEVVVEGAEDAPDVDGYALYLGTSVEDKDGDRIGTLEGSTGTLTGSIALATAFNPALHTHLLAFAYNDNGDSPHGVAVPLSDSIYPTAIPASVDTFVDESCTSGVVTGTLRFGSAVNSTTGLLDQLSLDSYAVFFGDSSGNIVGDVMEPLAAVAKSADFAHAVEFENFAVTDGATTLLVRARKGDCVHPDGVQVDIDDNATPSSSSVTGLTATLKDVDAHEGAINGSLTVSPAFAYQGLYSYAVYWASSATASGRNELLTLLGKDEGTSALVHTFEGAVAIPINPDTNDPRIIASYFHIVPVDTTTPHDTILCPASVFAAVRLREDRSAAPQHFATGLEFVDLECAADAILGSAVITRSDNEVDIDGYNLYFGTSADAVHPDYGFIGTAVSSQEVVEWSQRTLTASVKEDGFVSEGVTHLICRAYNVQSFATSVASQGISISLVDVVTPTQRADAIHFSDIDPDLGQLHGELLITGPDSDEVIDSYEVYWATEGSLLPASPLAFDSSLKSDAVLVSEDNLRAGVGSQQGTAMALCSATITSNSHFEVYFQIVNATDLYIGLAPTSVLSADTLTSVSSFTALRLSDGTFHHNGTARSYAQSSGTGDIVSMVVEHGALSFSINGRQPGVALADIGSSALAVVVGDESLASAGFDVRILGSSVHEHSYASAKLSGVDKVASVPYMERATVSYTIPEHTSVPLGATHFLVVSAQAQCEMDEGTPLAIRDTFLELPVSSAAAATFEDTDCDVSQIGGTVVITRAEEESDRLGYNVYLANTYGANIGTEPVATVLRPDEGTAVVPTLDATVPSNTDIRGASFLNVYAYNQRGDSEVKVVIVLADVFSPTTRDDVGLDFADSNAEARRIDGDATITRSEDESDLSYYALYWGVDNTTKLDGHSVIASLEVPSTSSTTLTYTFPSSTLVPIGASTLLVFPRNGVIGTCEPSTGASVAVGDLVAAVPTNGPQQAALADTNCDAALVGGPITIDRLAEDTDAVEYKVYLGSDATTKQSDTPVATASVTDDDHTTIEVELDSDATTIGSATHLLVFSSNSYGENPTPAAIDLSSSNAFSPSDLASSVSWLDEDTNAAQVKGTLSFTAASAPSYLLVWADSDDNTIQEITELECSGTCQYVFAQNTPVPEGATQFLVFSKFLACQSTSATAEPVADVDTDPPTAVSDFAVTLVTESTVTLTWGSSSTATHYSVARKLTGAASYVTVNATAFSPFTDTGLTLGTSYSYRVIAVNGNGNSDSAELLDVVPTTLSTLKIPELLVASVTNDSVTVEWQAPNATETFSYKVEYKEAQASDFDTASIAYTSDTTHTVAGLTLGTLYAVRVSAGNLAGFSPEANSVVMAMPGGLTWTCGVHLGMSADTTDANTVPALCGTLGAYRGLSAVANADLDPVWVSDGVLGTSTYNALSFDGFSMYSTVTGVMSALNDKFAMRTMAWVKPLSSTAATDEVVISRWGFKADLTSGWSARALDTSAGYFGGAFDGRHVYFAPYSTGDADTPNALVVRFDTFAETQTAGFQDNEHSLQPFPFETSSAAWEDTQPSAAQGGYQGALFADPWVVFVPHGSESAGGSVGLHGEALLFNASASAGGLAADSSWHVVDLTTAHSSATGFAGGVFDGVYVYFVPSANSVAVRMRVDTLELEAVDLSSVGSGGPYSGAVLGLGCSELADGTCIDDPFYYVYLVPASSATFVRFGPINSTFSDLSNWESVDATAALTSTLQPTASSVAPGGFAGGVSDGRYVYFAPAADGDGRVLRYDTRLSFVASVSWLGFQLSNTPSFVGAWFDLRYVYFVPGPHSPLVARYDTQKTFSLQSSWSQFDVSTLTGGDHGFAAAVWDGRYAYLCPNKDDSNALVSQVLRYDTLSTTSSFLLTAASASSYGGFSGAPSGPAFRVATSDHSFAVSVRERLEVGAWYHLVAEFNGAPGKGDHGDHAHYVHLVVNDVLVGSGLAVGNLGAAAGQSIVLGKAGATGKGEINAVMDEVWVFSPAVQPPSAPTGLHTSTVGPTTLDMAWTAAAGASFYKVQKAPIDFATGELVFETVGITENTHLTVELGVSGEPHTVRVFAGNAAGFEIVGTVANGTAVGDIANLTVVSINADGVVVSWDAPAVSDSVEGLTYTVQHYRFGTGELATVSDSLTSAGSAHVELEVAGINPGEVYELRVRAQVEALQATPATVEMTALSGVPSLYVSWVKGTAVRLQWGEVAGRETYLVQHKGSAEDDAQYGLDAGAEVTVDGNAATIASLGSSATRAFRVRAGVAPAFQAAALGSVVEAAALPQITSLQVTQVSATSVSLAWDATVVDAASDVVYKVEVRLANGTDADFAVFDAEVGTNAVTVTSLAASLSYVFRVRAGAGKAQSAGGEGGLAYYQHDDIAVSVTATPLDTVAGLVVVEVTASSVVLDWDDVQVQDADGADGVAVTYVLQRRLNSQTDAAYAVVAVTTESSFTHEPLVAGTTYRFRVFAGSQANQSDASGATVTGTPLSAITGLVAASVTRDSVLVQFRSVLAATVYKVEARRADAADFAVVTSALSVVAEANTEVSYSVPTNDTGYTHDIRVRAGRGSFFHSDATAQVVTGTPLEPIEATVAYVDATSARLSWQTVPCYHCPSGTVRYAVERKQNTATAYTLLSLADDSATDALVSGLTTGSRYDFRVRAGVEAWQVDDAAAVLSATPLSAVASLRVVGLTSTSLDLEWAVVGGASRYLVQVFAGGSGSGSSVDPAALYSQPDVATNAWTVPNLEAGTLYTVAVRAGNQAYQHRTLAQTVEGRPLGPVAGLAVDSVTDSSVTVSWTPSTGATLFGSAYVISSKSLYKTADASKATSASALTFTGLAVSQDYFVKILAGNDDAIFQPLDEAAVVAVTPLAQVGGLEVTELGESFVTVQWDPTPRSTQYRVQWTDQDTLATESVDLSDYDAGVRYLVGNETFVTLDRLNFTVPGLTKDTAYTITVFAGVSTWFETVGTSLEAVPQSATTATVANLAVVSVTPTSVYLEWDAAPDAARTYGFAKYRVEFLPADEAALDSGSAAAFNVSSDAVLDDPFRDATSHNITGLEPDITYEIRVTVGNLAGFSESFVALEQHPHGAPSAALQNLRVGTLLTSGVARNSLSVFWDSVPSTLFYTVEYKEGKEDDRRYRVAAAALDASTTNFTVTGLSSARVAPYTVRVVAHNLAGAGSSATTSATPLSPPTEPVSTLLAVEVLEDTVRLQWEGVADAFVYRIDYRAHDEAEFRLANHTAACCAWWGCECDHKTTVTSFTVRGLDTTAATFYFKVTAGNDAGFANVSAIVSAETFNAMALFDATNQGCFPSTLDQAQHYLDTEVGGVTAAAQTFVAGRTGFLERVVLWARLGEADAAALDAGSGSGGVDVVVGLHAVRGSGARELLGTLSTTLLAPALSATALQAVSFDLGAAGSSANATEPSASLWNCVEAGGTYELTVNASSTPLVLGAAHSRLSFADRYVVGEGRVLGNASATGLDALAGVEEEGDGVGEENALDFMFRTFVSRCPDCGAATRGLGWAVDTHWGGTNNGSEAVHALDGDEAISAGLCSWFGVRCAQGQVVALSLAGNNLDGSFPEELTGLVHLTSLELADNALRGTLPTTVSQYQALASLDLSNNQMHGTIPLEIGLLQHLAFVDLSHNAFTGPVPVVRSGQYPWVVARFSDNALSGGLPSQLGAVGNLTELALDRNSLSGTVPAHLGDLPALQRLALARNALEGSAPAALSRLSTLETLDLGRNALTGTIPPQWGDMAALAALHLQDNLLEGTVPGELGAVASLALVNVTNNRLVGSVPAALGPAVAVECSGNFLYNASAGCTPHRLEFECGNGVATANATHTEGCDDGNLADGDGCSAACAVELGWQCRTVPSTYASVCEEVCGDGVRTAGEECDSGGAAGCTDCTVDDAFVCPTNALLQTSVCEAFPAPEVTALWPASSGWTRGGFEVVVLGANLGKDAAAVVNVSLAGVACECVRRVNESAVVCKAGQAPAAVADGDVVVWTASGSGALSGAFSYEDGTPAVTALDPSTLAANSAGDVVVWGQNLPFSPDSTPLSSVLCRFTHRYAPTTYNATTFTTASIALAATSPTSMGVRCTLPVVPAGDYNVSLSVDAGVTWVDGGDDLVFVASCDGFSDDVVACVSDRACVFCHHQDTTPFREGQVAQGSCRMCDKRGEDGDCRALRDGEVDEADEGLCAVVSWVEDKDPECCGMHSQSVDQHGIHGRSETPVDGEVGQGGVHWYKFVVPHDNLDIHVRVEEHALSSVYVTARWDALPLAAFHTTVASTASGYLHDSLPGTFDFETTTWHTTHDIFVDHSQVTAAAWPRDLYVGVAGLGIPRQDAFEALGVDLGDKPTASAYTLNVRFDPHYSSFTCGACGGDCGACGVVVSANATRLVDALSSEALAVQHEADAHPAAQPKLDELAANSTTTTTNNNNNTNALVRLVETRIGGDQGPQVGSAFLSERVVVDHGFEASFTFRMHNRSLCVAPVEYTHAIRTSDLRRTNFPATSSGGEPPCPPEGSANAELGCCNRRRSVSFPDATENVETRVLVWIESDNAHGAGVATLNDTVTLHVVSNEDITALLWVNGESVWLAPTTGGATANATTVNATTEATTANTTTEATTAGQGAGEAGTAFAHSWTISGDAGEGEVEFYLQYNDTSGNPGEAFVATDGSTVVVDLSPPTMMLEVLEDGDAFYDGGATLSVLGGGFTVAVIFSEDVEGFAGLGGLAVDTGATGATATQAVEVISRSMWLLAVDGVANVGTVNISLAANQTIVDAAGLLLANSPELSIPVWVDTSSGSGSGNGSAKSLSPSNNDFGDFGAQDKAGWAMAKAGWLADCAAVDIALWFDAGSPTNQPSATLFASLAAPANLSIGNFTLDSGTTGAVLNDTAGLVQVNATLYTLEVVSAAADGTLTVAFCDGTTSASLVVDTTPPQATSYASSTSSPTTAAESTVTVVFSEAVFGSVDVGNVVVVDNGTGVGVASVDFTSGAASLTIALANHTGVGWFSVVLANDTAVADAAGNALDVGTGLVMEVVVVVQNALVATLTPLDAGPTSARSNVFVVDFSKNVTGFGVHDVRLVAASTNAVLLHAVQTTPTRGYVAIDGATGDGTYTLVVVHTGTVVGEDGSTLASSVSASVQVNTTAASTTYTASHAGLTNATTSVVEVLLPSAASSLAASDFSIESTAAATGGAAAVVSGVVASVVVVDTSSNTSATLGYSVALTHGGEAETFLLRLNDGVVDDSGSVVPRGAGVLVTTDYTAPELVRASVSVLASDVAVAAASAGGGWEAMAGASLNLTLVFSESLGLALTVDDVVVGGRAPDSVTASGADNAEFVVRTRVTRGDAPGELLFSVRRFRDGAGNTNTHASESTNVTVVLEPMGPADVAFVDEEPRQGWVAGSVVVSLATDNSNVHTSYVVYLADTTALYNVSSVDSGVNATTNATTITTLSSAFDAADTQQAVKVVEFASEGVSGGALELNLVAQELPFPATTLFVRIETTNQQGDRVDGGAWAAVDVDDRFAPTITEQPSERSYVTNGDAVVWTCAAAANPDAQITWTKDWTVLAPASHTPTLTLASPALKDEGVYRCHAANALGSVDSVAFALVVDSVPEAAADAAVFLDEDPTALVGGTLRVFLPESYLAAVASAGYDLPSLLTGFNVYWSDGVGGALGGTAGLVGSADVVPGLDTVDVEIVATSPPYANATYFFVVSRNEHGEMAAGLHVAVRMTQAPTANDTAVECPSPATGVYSAECAEEAAVCEGLDAVANQPVSGLRLDQATTNLYDSVCGASDGLEGKVGGEGFAFVVHSDERGAGALGCAGTGAGFAGDGDGCTDHIRRSVAVEFDSFFNVRLRKLDAGVHSLNASTVVEYDSDATVSVFLDGSNDHSHDRLAEVHTAAMPTNFKINDGRVHAARVAWTPTAFPLGELVVWLDNDVEVARVEVDIDGVRDSDGKAWFGFTGSTGVGSESFDVVSWRVCASPSCVRAVAPSVERSHWTRSRAHV